MAKIPKRLQDNHLSFMLKENLKRIHQGKVRDTYLIDDDRLLVVATDRISIFDFVLNAEIPHKGEVLTALTHFWLTNVLKKFGNHLIPSEKDKTDSTDFNAAYDLAFDGVIPEYAMERSLVVKNMTGKVYPFEMIYRHHIGGSVFKSYQATGLAGGQKLPLGLPKWSKLDNPLFTPSTKEDVGHDINVDSDYFFQEMDKRGLRSEANKVNWNLANAYKTAYAYAEKAGILILDTKFEVAGLTIVDEVLTPDSSRFALTDDWEKAMKENRDPLFHDKQPIRDWGAKLKTPFKVDVNKQADKTQLFHEKNGVRDFGSRAKTTNDNIIGLNNLSPENPAHIDYVHNLEIPEEIIESAAMRYLDIFTRITKMPLYDYQVKYMGCGLSGPFDVCR